MVPRREQENPGQHEGPGNHNYWDNLADGSVRLPTIRIPALEVIRDMVRIGGGSLEPGKGLNPPLAPAPFVTEVLPFYLDKTEISVGAYMKARPYRDRLNRSGRTPGPPDEPVTDVSFDQALSYAEEIGKRLPDEFEYEFAATNGGTTRFPWGDDPKPIEDWKYGKAGEPAFDRTPGSPSVSGLFSNVAEWTLSWNVPYPTLTPDAMKAFFEDPAMQLRHRGTRIVRGGPLPVINHTPERRQISLPEHWDPRNRFGIPRNEGRPGLGFRCARSEKPRYLED
jgi:formylglycine-generating enzyme required for sulfatase activity